MHSTAKPARARRKLAVAVALVFALCAAGALGCVGFGPPSTAAAFAGRAPPTEHTATTPDGRTISFHACGASDGALIVLVHGTPGRWSDLAYVMADESLAARARIVSIDRPGWGASIDGGLDATLAGQARALAAVVESYSERPVIVAGHSYGAPVAARLALDRPELVDALMLVAGSIDPELEEPTWYQSLGRTWLVRPLVPEVLQRADLELLPLRGELEQLLPLWTRLAIPVSVLQGEDDALVPAANAAFAEREIPPQWLEVVRIPDQGHLIPWEQPGLIASALLRTLDRLARR
jgi:pimeloyl-ACP methyl ester carboxylesterase